MRFGKRRQDTTDTGEPAAPVSVADSVTRPPEAVTDSWTAPEATTEAEAQPVVEGEAVELPGYEPPVPPRVTQPGPDPMPFPVAEQPVTVVTPGPEPAPVTTLGESGEAYASGHAAAPGPSWQEPVMELANERPELVVAAAFAGGLLAALILRRLGN